MRFILKVNNVNNYCDVTNKMHDWIFDECHQMVKVNSSADQPDW